MTKEMEINLIINYHPSADCLNQWSRFPYGFQVFGKENRSCVQDVQSHMDKDFILWQLIHASNDAIDSSPFPPMELTQPMKSMLSFRQYREAARTLQVLHGHTPREIPLGRFSIKGLPRRHERTAGLIIYDPLEVCGRERTATLVRTRVQLRSGKPYYLGIGTPNGAHLSILAATFGGGHHG